MSRVPREEITTEELNRVLDQLAADNDGSPTSSPRTIRHFDLRNDIRHCCMVIAMVSDDLKDLTEAFRRQAVRVHRMNEKLRRTCHNNYYLRSKIRKLKKTFHRRLHIIREGLYAIANYGDIDGNVLYELVENHERATRYSENSQSADSVSDVHSVAQNNEVLQDGEVGVPNGANNDRGEPADRVRR